ncbi:MAG: cation:proton antiporter [Alphaproteobacteria bacterium]|nr:cation:proton antiporter [Alphaproteobacteria bacterium]
MGLEGLAIVAAAALAFALLSKRLEESVLTLPIFIVAFGWAIGPGGLGIVALTPSHGSIHILAEITLVLVLFSDASRIDLKRLIADHNLPQRMLLIGMPLTITLGAIAAVLLFRDMSWAMAFLLAAILTPTDAALGQSVVSNPVVPVRIRQALNVESGLNDGIALPFVLIFAIWAGASADASGAADLATFTLLQVTLGPAAGVAIGYAGAVAIDKASTHHWMAPSFEGIAILSVAALAFTAAELIGGNGFIAAFAAGLVFGATVQERCNFLLEFMETEGQILTLVTFLIFGTAMVPAAIAGFTVEAILYAILSLTLIRIIPIQLSLIGTGLSGGSTMFLSWFGPRGLASILFALLILEKHPIPGGDSILSSVVLTVLLSVLLHGVSAAPLAAAYSRFVTARGECEESKPVSEMPVRHKMSSPSTAE